MRAWAIGVGVGVVAGLIATVSGFLSGACCLFQFANALVPLGAGLIAGAAAASAAPYASLEPGANPTMLGVTEGGKASLLASLLSGTIAVLMSLLLPVLINLGTVLSSEDPLSALVVVFVSLGMQLVWAAAFGIGGGVIGLVLGVAAGAVIGTVMAPKR